MNNEKDGKTVKTSSFFVNQMYLGGLNIIPFPPLANEGFFRELNDTLEEVVVPDIDDKEDDEEDEDDDDDTEDDDDEEEDEDEMELLHHGGNSFLDHFKLVMSKLNIDDHSAMSGEQAKIRIQDIRDALKSAVATGCTAKPPANLYGGWHQSDHYL